VNHLEDLTAEWLNYNGYFTRSAVRVGRRSKGGWLGELDVVGFHAATQHFVHVECSMDALTWPRREEVFKKKLGHGRRYARKLFSDMNLPSVLDQVVILGFAGTSKNAAKHRDLGGGRLVTGQELTAEIMTSLPPTLVRAAVHENLPLLRTLQLSVMAGAKISEPDARLILKPHK
jgi:hypothetical protein